MIQYYLKDLSIFVENLNYRVSGGFYQDRARLGVNICIEIMGFTFHYDVLDDVKNT